MDETAEPSTLSAHLEHLAADAQDVMNMLTVPHSEDGDIHPEALPKAARLHQSLRDIIDAVKTHDHLAMKGDDVWSMLTVKHNEHDSGIS